MVERENLLRCRMVDYSDLSVISPKSPLMKLEPIQRRILAAQIQGFSIKEISQRLNILINHVDKHLERALLVLGMRDYTQTAPLFFSKNGPFMGIEDIFEGSKEYRFSIINRSDITLLNALVGKGKKIHTNKEIATKLKRSVGGVNVQIGESFDKLGLSDVHRRRKRMVAGIIWMEHRGMIK